MINVKRIIGVLSVIICCTLIYGYRNQHLFSQFHKIPLNFIYPTVSNYMKDSANSINEDAMAYVDSVGKELEEKTNVQAKVRVIKSLEGKEPENFMSQLLRKEKIDINKKEKIILILLSTEDKKCIVVSDGLKYDSTKMWVSNIADEIGEGVFKDNKYSEGVKKLYSALTEKIASEYNVTLEKNIKLNVMLQQSKRVNNNVNIIYFTILLGIIFFDITFNKTRIIKSMVSILFIRAYRKERN